MTKPKTCLPVKTYEVTFIDANFDKKEIVVEATSLKMLDGAAYFYINNTLIGFYKNPVVITRKD